MQFDLAPPLADAKAAAILKVDRDAETARLRFLTAGAGQAAEYLKTEAEARAYQAAGFPTFVAADAPFLQAEITAVQAATGVAPPANLVALEVIAQADAWNIAGSAIKALRRGAKLLIEAATTHAEIHAALQISWPEA